MTSTPSAKTIELEVKFVVPGMRLARPVYAGDGTNLAAASTIVTKALLKNLHNWDIDKVSVFTETAVNPIIEPQMQQFLHSYNQSVSTVQKAFDNIRLAQELPISDLINAADDISSQTTTTTNLLEQLYNLPPCDDYTFRHCVNVSAISALIATWLKYPPASISAIALSGLLHDIGKARLPAEILNQPHSLSPQDYALYQTHPRLGYQLVNAIPNIAQSVLSGILDHHERTDGQGYPGRLAGEDIHPYARIVAIADLFDEALTIGCDVPGLSPYASLDRLRDNIHFLDPKICLTFLDNMTNFLSGNIVSLSNGLQGRVAYINKDKPSRSIIQLEDGQVLNLTEFEDLCIRHIIK